MYKNSKLAEEEGIEPSNAGIKTQCLRPLGYSPKTGLRFQQATRKNVLMLASFLPVDLPIEVPAPWARHRSLPTPDNVWLQRGGFEPPTFGL